MAIRPSAALLAGLLAGVMPLALPLAAQPALAQAVSPNQPLAIEASPGLSPPACRLLVPRSEAVLQPLRIHPAQVAQKNSMGCLSAADARYGPDGCPSQLCGQKHGYQVPLPAQIGR
ncbi:MULTISPECIES: hypothetical protein [unclassified Cyanobium]|uniref:hypothetical protein n=1 Tax=unclassified Cyanobium TaxID=2627006 RepID=UPI0020CB6D46|nr:MULTISPECIES: hypothetical protein [unclassified Cyanobium]MCP9832868.1 hypothetical protein [Cyanobium sp. La Preciosa 7G6]MCP9935618.1 hypothetical protein [Cyanobium sp. Aljojuca 7A6]